MFSDAIFVHGWDPDKYNKLLPATDLREESIGWSKSPDFIDLVSEEFSVDYCNMPGFCGVVEPQKISYSVEDFADYLNLWKQSGSRNPKFILGFSFGGAVALFHKVKFRDKLPIVLVSPAIKRRETLKSQIGHQAKKFVPSAAVDVVKKIYQGFASEYYRRGTPFLRATYDKIVREDLTRMIWLVPPGEALFIFGEHDLETPWELVKDAVTGAGHNYLLIQDAGHSMIKSHPHTVVTAIKQFVNGQK